MGREREGKDRWRKSRMMKGKEVNKEGKERDDDRGWKQKERKRR